MSTERKGWKSHRAISQQAKVTLAEVGTTPKALNAGTPTWGSAGHMLTKSPSATHNRIALASALLPNCKIKTTISDMKNSLLTFVLISTAAARVSNPALRVRQRSSAAVCSCN